MTPRWLHLSRRLPALGLLRREVVVLRELMQRDRADRAHVATVAAIGRSVGYSERSVHRALDRLDALGLVAVCQRRKDRWKLASAFKVRWHALADMLLAVAEGAAARLAAVMEAARAKAAQARAGWQARRAANPLFSRSATLADKTAPQGKSFPRERPQASDPGLWAALAEARDGSEAFNRAADALIRAGQAANRDELRPFARSEAVA